MATTRSCEIWKEAALIWEGQQNYLYARTTATGRRLSARGRQRGSIEPDRARRGDEENPTSDRGLVALWQRAKDRLSIFAGPAP